MSAVGGRASPIAQLVERVAVNRKVAGSNPAGREASRFAQHPKMLTDSHAHNANSTPRHFAPHNLYET